jgi:hypothetical protein
MTKHTLPLIKPSKVEIFYECAYVNGFKFYDYRGLVFKVGAVDQGSVETIYIEEDEQIIGISAKWHF